MPLRRAEQRQLGEPPLGRLHGAGQEHRPLAGQAPHRRPVIEVGVEHPGACQLAGRLDQVDGQVELRGRSLEVERLQAEARHLEPVQLHVLQRQQHLVHRRARQVARQVEAVDQALERQILVRKGVQADFARPSQQLPERRLAGRIDAQRQGVDEQADQALGLRQPPAGDGRAHDDVKLPAVTRQQGHEPGQQGHEQRRALALRQPSELPRQVAVELYPVTRAVEALDRRPRPIGRQLELRRCARQARPPVGQLVLQDLAPQVVALPGGELRVLDRQLGQGRRLAPQRRRVERLQLADQDAQRPAVGGDVVDGQQGRVLARAEPHQPQPQQRAGHQVERALCLRVRQQPDQAGPPRDRQEREIDDRQSDRQRRMDHLLELVPDGAEGGDARL